MASPPRYLTDHDFKNYIPVHVVWEITLACDLKCLHCGSRAGKKRPGELSTSECLEVVDSLAGLGTREITLIGGEAYLRRDWLQIIRRICDHGIYVATQTGGHNFNPKRLSQAVEAGLGGLGVSLDGLEPLHDKLRNVPGSFKRAVDTLHRAHEAGLNVSVNTQIGSEVIPQLPELMDLVIRLGAKQWQIQITVAMGNAVDHPELLLQPYRVLELMPVLAKLYKEGAERGLLLVMGNNIGYFGPYEHLWRGFGDEHVHWGGCTAGQTALALEADGTVKGCPSLATVGFAGGNIRDLTIEDIWSHSKEVHFGRLRSLADLWGFCATCYYADVCRGGCTWTSHSLLGEPGNNPYCHYRALKLEEEGLRERIEKIQDAAPTPFAVGGFRLITERISDGAVITAVNPRKRLVQLGNVETDNLERCEGRVPPRLALCRACNSYVWPSETACPHCHVDLRTADKSWAEDVRRRTAAMTALKGLIEKYGGDQNCILPNSETS